MISIISSVYNSENYIREMLNSILAQTYTDWELIIFDDASTDSTWNILQSYSDKRIRCFRNENNVGLTCNLNKALREAKGEYVARIDGDDIAAERRLEIQAKYLMEHRDVLLVGTDMLTFGDYVELWSNPTDYNSIRMQMIFNVALYHPTYMFRRTVIDDYSLFYDERFRYAQDYCFQIHIAKIGLVGNIPIPLLRYRVHAKQIGIEHSLAQKQCADEVRDIILDYLEIELNSMEKSLWNSFCRMDFETEVDAEELKMICSKIVISNAHKGWCEADLLDKYMKERIERYFAIFESSRHAIRQNSKKQNDRRISTLLLLLIKKRTFGYTIIDYLNRHKYFNVMIYGFGILGEALFSELITHEEIEVTGIIDKVRDSIGIPSKLVLYRPDEKIQGGETLIITVADDYEKIRQKYQGVFENILSIDELIFNI